MDKIKQLFGKIDRLQQNIGNEEIKQVQNNKLFINLSNSDSFLKKIQDFSTEFEYMDCLEDEGEVVGVYKQWEVVVYVDENIEEVLDYILPFIKYEIIFNEIGLNSVNYYNSHDDLHVVKFFNVQNNQLILSPSIYMKKVFNGETLIVPQVKLKISLINPNYNA